MTIKYTPLHLIPLYLDQPQNQNFVAFFSDGSGAELFCHTGDGKYCDATGEHCEFTDLEADLMDNGFISWLPLPDDCDFFFMQGLMS